jgi:hypothetical protein
MNDSYSTIQSRKEDAWIEKESYQVRLGTLLEAGRLTLSSLNLQGEIYRTGTEMWVKHEK